MDKLQPLANKIGFSKMPTFLIYNAIIIIGIILVIMAVTTAGVLGWKLSKVDKPATTTTPKTEGYTTASYGQSTWAGGALRDDTGGSTRGMSDAYKPFEQGGGSCNLTDGANHPSCGTWDEGAALEAHGLATVGGLASAIHGTDRLECAISSAYGDSTALTADQFNQLTSDS